MPKRNAELLIADILSALDKIERYIREMNRETFQKQPAFIEKEF